MSTILVRNYAQTFLWLLGQLSWLYHIFIIIEARSCEL